MAESSVGFAPILAKGGLSGPADFADAGQFLHIGMMNSQNERYERWEPLAGLPEAPLSQFDCSFRNGQLTVTAAYASSGAGQHVLIEFDYVEAFKVYEEFSDPWMGTGAPLPMLAGVDQKWVCPLQQVLQSTWVSHVMRRNGGIERQWHHYVVSTQDFTLHVMTSGPPLKVELTSK